MFRPRPDVTPDLARALDRAMAGDLARFRPGLAAPDDPRPTVGPDRLLDAPHRAALVRRFDDRYGRTDPRAVVAIWSSWYVTAVLPPLLAANILLDRAPDLALDRVGFIVGPDLRIEALRPGPIVTPLRGLDPAARFDGLVAGHLAPLVRLIVARGGVSPRVVWSNVGNAFEAFLGKLAPFAARRAGYRHARELLASRTWAGQPNPLFEPVRRVDGRPVRRVCCMRFLVPDGRLCAACPLPTGHPARVAPATSPA